jgi:hypothetical protein
MITRCCPLTRLTKGTDMNLAGVCGKALEANASDYGRFCRWRIIMTTRLTMALAVGCLVAAGATSANAYEEPLHQPLIRGIAPVEGVHQTKKVAVHKGPGTPGVRGITPRGVRYHPPVHNP